jgi:hypothetical protein
VYTGYVFITVYCVERERKRCNDVHLSILVFIEDTENTKQALDALTQQFQSARTAHFLTATVRLFNLCKRADQMIAGYFTEINDLVALAFPNINDMIAADTLSMVKAQVQITLQKLIDKWMLAVTLHGPLTEYNTVKAIIQDWSNPNLKKAQSHICKRELKLKSGTPNPSNSEKLLLTQDRGAHRRGKQGSHKGQHQGSNGSNPHSSNCRHSGQLQWPQPADKGSRPTCAYCHKPGHTNVECYH